MDAKKPRFHFTIWQIIESVFWASVAMAMVAVIDKYGQEAWFNNDILLFTGFLPGPLFGAAVGSLFGKRAICSVIGFFVWLVVMWLWAPFAQ